MRLRVLLDAAQPIRIPMDHQELLAETAATVLSAGEAGETLRGDCRFPLFVFSTLRIPARQRTVDGSDLQVAPGRLSWYLSSPGGDAFQQIIAEHLTRGSDFPVGQTPLRVAGIEVMPEPAFGATATFTALTPIVAAVPLKDRDAPYYLRPCDTDAFSQTVRANLLQKFELLYQARPANRQLRLTWDGDYLARAPHGGTKKVRIGNKDIVGVQAPLTLTGSPELIRLAFACGLGEKNGLGFGMLDPVTPRRAG